jgi:bifunctional DNA-binding transcriptional regulator/antitoxin component of YhaV-PrlF toxin-antitoxin module
MSELTVSVTLTEKGEIPVPEELRRALGLMPRQLLRLRQLDDRILVEKELTGPRTLRERAALIVREAKLQAARDAATMTPEEVWAAYDDAAKAVRKALAPKRKRKRAR